MHSHVRLPFVCQPISIQHFNQPDRIDETQTALREAAYIRRTRFIQKGAEALDFAKRGEDLFMLTPILPVDSPKWVCRPFLRWKRADDAAEATGRLDDIRAWHICGDLKKGLTRGQWSDQVEEMVRFALPSGIVAEIAGHIPRDKPPHVHILVASRYVGNDAYEQIAYDLHRRLNEDLRQSWADWLA